MAGMLPTRPMFYSEYLLSPGVACEIDYPASKAVKKLLSLTMFCPDVGIACIF
jgi:hypothetical protein